MASVTFSARVSETIMDRARDAVAKLQGDPFGLTMSGLAESSMRRQVTAAKRKRRSSIPARPEGESAGIRGRRKDRGSPIKRVTYCTKVSEEVRKAWRDLAYLTREEIELAELFEVGLAKEISRLEKKFGPIEAREGGGNLRPGRRVK